MLFNSYDFIFLFLPFTFGMYFFLGRFSHHLDCSKAFLVLASLFFYSYWNPVYLPLLLGSMIFNFYLSVLMSESAQRKVLLIFGLILNLGVLGYFKYANFFISNLNFLSDSGFSLISITLPLAISFFTFQQIAYLVDSYKQDVIEHDFINYSLFVTFFPQLIAGPIVHHKEMMPQFSIKENEVFSDQNFSNGLFIFSIGLFKKVVIADYLSKIVTIGYEQKKYFGIIEGWVTSTSYTFQLYFDFSGYTDMAIGLALLFNIQLPQNFNSPYKATNIQDFWRRWHMTLSRFLKDYLYIPLGGNRCGEIKTCVNLFVTFLLGGLWHGASWMFVIWGTIHGIALITHRVWGKMGFKLPRWAAWLITFQFVNVSWIFFRSSSLEEVIKILRAMIGLNGLYLNKAVKKLYPNLEILDFRLTKTTLLNEGSTVVILMCALIVTIFFKNSQEIKLNQRPIKALVVAGLAIAALITIDAQEISEFLYFDF